MILFRSRQPKVRPNLQIQQAWDIYLNSGGSTNAIIAGHGSEGVVFRENGLATKILHDDIAETEEEHPNLKDNLAIMKGFSGLPKNYSIQKLGQKVIVRYDWVDGQHPTFKTEIQPWLNLLRACRENGCVYWDLKPQNLILTPDGELVIIDIGRNLKPFSEHAWQSMIRKAFLCWRWWFRLDLRSLLTLSIRFDNPGKMPELTDIDYFIQAIEIHDKADLHDPWFVEIMNSKKPGKLLDWGCGKGTLSKQIADIGFDVEAWDPITDYIDSVADHPQVKWIDGINEVKEGYYDTAISTLVLWVIEDEEEVVDVLRTLRRGISESGKVIATVCHPLQMCTQCSTSVERPLQQMEFGRLTFEKRIRTTNRIRVEHVRSLERLEMLAARANLRISGLIESPGVDINRCAVMPEYLAIEFKPIPKPKHTDVELLILACSMDHSIIEKQVKHVVKQLGGRERFEKVTVVTDDSVTGFVRPWDEPDIDEYKAGLERLIQEEIITQVLWAPKNEDDIQKLNERWYGMSVPINKAVNGQPVHTSLWGLEQSSSTYVLQIDVDIMIHRDWSIDPTDLLIDCLIKKEAVTATLPILSESNSPPRILDGIDWRTEVRFCIFDRQKIMRLRPMKNSIEEGKWQLPWHKTMDARIEQTGGGSLRLIDGMNWFVHPQNEDKVESLDLHRVRRRIERGEVSDLQKGHVDMVSWEDSHGIRNEGIVVIVRGRNTPYSFIRRHIDSMQSQTDQEFGIIWIDAASDDYSQPHFEYILDCEFPNRVTFIWNEIPRPRCENILLATKYIANPEAILILLDADDAFAGPEIISHVRDVFEDGVEVAVGGMLRLDKQQSYPVDFVNPRTNRGGNVWQHLKCFRKRCIEIVPVEMFRMDDEFIHDEDDWALMLPIVEVSNHHHQFTRSMMIYTISENKMLRSHEERDERIARIVGKPSLR
jgi:2-polyprenyl-3-methyl-5-hydroxy-6-metoxy-1,4-benzoquinol methylase